MRTRLAVVKNLAEGGVRAQRDPRTGFAPPGQRMGVQPADRQAAPPAHGRGPTVPSSVVLPPPHVPDAGEAYDHRRSSFHGDSVIFFSEGVGRP